MLSLRANFLQRLPDEIGLIAQLRVLNVSGNRLRHLPLAIAKLRNLQALWLAENQTTPLPKLLNDVDYTDFAAGVRVLSCPLLPQAGDARSQLAARPADEAGSSDNNNNHLLNVAGAAVPKSRRNVSGRPADGFANGAWVGSNGAIATHDDFLQSPPPTSRVAGASGSAFGAPAAPYLQPALYPAAVSAAYQQRIDPMNPAAAQSKRTRSTPGHYSDSEVRYSSSTRLIASAQSF